MRIVHWRATVTGVLVAALLSVGTSSTSYAEDCEVEFSSTFDLIQKAIFENRGCTSSFCHEGTFPAGGLDLTEGNSYDSLIGVPAQTVADWQRVVPGQRDISLLFVNVAAKTFPGQVHAPLRAMPLDPIPALTSDQVDALRRWIEAGAPKDGVVPKTGELLDACLPPPEPIEITPLPPPPAGVGVQIRMPRWYLDPHSEHEVCYASYYDVTAQVPVEFLSPDGKSFRYKSSQIRQDPLSHHLIVNSYEGRFAPDASQWGTFRCRGGEHENDVCNPLDIDPATNINNLCGPDGGCANDPQIGVACVGAPPGDGGAGVGLNSGGFTGTQETAASFNYPEGVYNEVALKGMILWNSHAFNLTDKRGKLEAWLNFDFAPMDEQITPVRGIFNTTKLFATNTMPYTAEEICQHHVLPPDAQLFELSSHTHKRGKRWRTFIGRFSCDGGPKAGAPCSPFGPDEQYNTPDLCAGAPCRSETDPDGDPQDSLVYTNLVYNDPLVLRFDPPRAFPGVGSSDAERTLTFCSIYDNGVLDPAEVKKQSTSPPTPIGIPGLIGGPCVTPTHCTEGRVGEACIGDNDVARDASCNSPMAGDCNEDLSVSIDELLTGVNIALGADSVSTCPEMDMSRNGAVGVDELVMAVNSSLHPAPSIDGSCDACPLKGGVTTEDEMFILMGSFYVP